MPFEPIGHKVMEQAFQGWQHSSRRPYTRLSQSTCESTPNVLFGAREQCQEAPTAMTISQPTIASTSVLYIFPGNSRLKCCNGSQLGQFWLFVTGRPYFCSCDPIGHLRIVDSCKCCFVKYSGLTTHTSNKPITAIETNSRRITSLDAGCAWCCVYVAVSNK